MTNKIYSEIVMMKTEELKPNPYNPNEMTEEQFAYLVDDIRQNGFVGQPIIINDQNEIIDGEHRWLAGKALNFEMMPTIRFNPENEDHQKMLVIGWNSKRGEFHPVKLAKLILDLSQKYTLDELSMKLGFSAMDLKDRLFLTQVTDEFMDKIKKDAEDREKDIPSTLIFAVSKEQEAIILSALEKAQGKGRGDRLEDICKQYLSLKSV